MDMRIHLFEVNVLLFSEEKRKNPNKSILQANLYCLPIRSKELHSQLNNRMYLYIKPRKWRQEKQTHKALAILLTSFSQSSKKRDTTSTTKSGLLSSCSFCNWVNWSSTKPFSKPTKKPHVKNPLKPLEIKVYNPLIDFQGNEILPKKTISLKNKNKI